MPLIKLPSKSMATSIVKKTGYIRGGDCWNSTKIMELTPEMEGRIILESTQRHFKSFLDTVNPYNFDIEAMREIISVIKKHMD